MNYFQEPNNDNTNIIGYISNAQSIVENSDQNGVTVDNPPSNEVLTKSEATKAEREAKRLHIEAMLLDQSTTTIVAKDTITAVNPNPTPAIVDTTLLTPAQLHYYKVYGKLHSGVSRLNARLTDVFALPTRAEPVIWAGEVKDDNVLLRPGGLMIITGKAKAGKTAVIGAILAGAIKKNGDAEAQTLKIGVAPCPDDKRVMYVDTEQPEYEFQSALLRIMFRLGLPTTTRPKHFYPFPVGDDKRAARLELIEEALTDPNEPPVHLLIIDGVSDLILSVNDEIAAADLVERIGGWARNFNIAIVLVLHENQKSSSGSGARGWLGSELERKAGAQGSISRDDNEVSTLKFLNCRTASNAADLGFEWCNIKKMHVECSVNTGKKTPNGKKAPTEPKWSRDAVDDMVRRHGLKQNHTQIGLFYGVKHHVIQDLLEKRRKEVQNDIPL